MSNQWVQHISGQGEKWEVREEAKNEWCVVARVEALSGNHWLPKSEYHLCPAPEVWVDVTGECRESKRGAKNNFNGSELGHFLVHNDHDLAKLICGGAYRLRKVHASVESAEKYWKTGWAFIIEKKVRA